MQQIPGRFDKLMGVRQKRRTGGGKTHRTAIAVEQADLRVAFERLDLVGERRPGDAQPLCRATEVQLPCDRDEVAHLAQLYPASVMQ